VVANSHDTTEMNTLGNLVSPVMNIQGSRFPGLFDVSKFVVKTKFGCLLSVFITRKSNTKMSISQLFGKT
jgi:hypothetical protein